MADIVGSFSRSNTAATSAALSQMASAIQIPRSNQDVVFVDVGDRKIDSNIVRDGVPVVAHPINPDILASVVIASPIISYRIVGQTVAPGTPVPLDTSVDVVLAEPGRLPVGVIEGVHTAFAQASIADAFSTLIAGHPEAVRLVARASEGPLSTTDEQTLSTLFESAGAPLTDTPGQDASAALTTLQMLTTFGGP